MKNFNRRARVRLAAAPLALFAVGAMVGVAAPAQAEALEPAANLVVSIPGEKVAVGSAGKFVRIDVVNKGNATATNSRLRLRVTDVADDVTITLPGEPEGCQTTATGAECALGELEEQATVTQITVLVEPKADARRGVVGKLTAEVASDATDSDPSDNTDSVELELVRNASDLVVYSADFTIDHGETFDFGLAVANNGSRRAPLLDVMVQLPKYVDFEDQSETDNCAYLDESTNVVWCGWRNFAPGGYVVATIPVKLNPAAPGPAKLGGTVKALAAEKDEAGATLKRADGEAEAGFRAQLKPDASPGDNTVNFTVTTGENTRDLAVAATSASGAVGATVTSTIEANNLGPAGGGAIFKIKAPAGTVVLNSNAEAGPDCWTGATNTEESRAFTEAAEVTCVFSDDIAPGAKATFGVKFKINSSPVGDGKVEISDNFGTPDLDAANNSAAITITIGNAGSLPITGVQVGVIGAVGVAVVAVGAGLLVLSRRRRVVTVAPSDESGDK
jgi:Domain of unknown function DUF11